MVRVSMIALRCPVYSMRSIAAFSSAAGKTSKPKGEGSSRKKSPPPPNIVPEPNQAAGDSYNVPEYYLHNVDSYADLNLDMQKYRLPRPVRPGR